MKPSEFPESIKSFGTVLAVCKPEFIINPLLKNKLLPAYSKLYIILPKFQSLIYRDRKDSVSYCRKDIFSKSYYVFLNEIQISLEDPSFMVLFAPDSLFYYQTEKFKELREGCSKNISWFFIRDFLNSFALLCNNYYQSDRIFDLSSTQGNSSTTTIIDYSNYAYFNTCILNIVRLYLLFTKKSDWFWSDELINSTALLYYKNGAESLKVLISKVMEEMPEGPKSAIAIQNLITSFIYKTITQEN